MKKLGEPKATVRCRQVDLALVKEVLEPARKAYAALVSGEAPALTLDSATFLPPPPTSMNEGDASASW